MKINKKEMLLHSVTRLMSRKADAHLRRLLIKSHPSEIAAVIRQLPDEDAVALMKQLYDTEKEGDVFIELEGKFLETYLEATNEVTHIVNLMHNLPEDEAAGLLADINEELSQKILSLMKESKKDEVNEILQYKEDTCGRIMAVNVFSLPQDLTAMESITEIQKSSDLESLFYIYIVDEFKNLVGVVSMRQILQVKPDRLLKDFMTRDLITVNVFDSQQKVATFVEEYNFVSLPVVDDTGKLVGMVTVDDVIDYIYDEAQDEVLHLAGVESEAIDAFTFWRAFVSRITWYSLLFLGGLLCTEIILYYFSSFPREILFLCFAPLVLRFGGSVSTQSVTFLHQSILNEDIEKSRAVKALWGQNLTSILVAFILATIVGFYGIFRFSLGTAIPLGLGLGLFIVAVFSIVTGTIMTFLFHKLRLDSLKASSRFIHFLMDALSLLVFFKFLQFWVTQVTDENIRQMWF